MEVLDSIDRGMNAVNEMNGLELGEQVWVDRSNNHEPLSEKIKNVVNDCVKPTGGFWTSSPHEKWPSHWIDWMINASFHDDEPYRLWHLLPEPTAKLLVVDSEFDLEAVLKRWPWCRTFPDFEAISEFPDFEAISELYDGFHLTDYGQWATRTSLPQNLYGWDCESTLWFRWAFGSVKEGSRFRHRRTER